MKKNVKNVMNYVNELNTVKCWKTGCELYGIAATVYAGIVTLPIAVAAGTVEAGVKKTKEYIDKKTQERVDIIVKQYMNDMNTTTVGL